eukprot:351475-Chlamydomonas_euryale.AAC.3
MPSFVCVEERGGSGYHFRGVVALPSHLSRVVQLRMSAKSGYPDIRISGADMMSRIRHLKIANRVSALPDAPH